MVEGGRRMEAGNWQRHEHRKSGAFGACHTKAHEAENTSHVRKESYDVVVCGGGLAGFCAAVAAARHGARACLVQDRPVFGGNSSSEVRVTPHGAAAFHVYAKETGIISEPLIEERARNHEVIFENGWTNSVWDMAMYDLAVRTPNLTFT